MKSQNLKQLNDFTDYCLQHPEQRFYQALRNWSQYNFIYGSMGGLENKMDKLIGLEDTFYK